MAGPKKSKKAAKTPEPSELRSGRPLVVVGNGWAALGLVGLLSSNKELQNNPIVWLTGTGGRIISPLPSLEASAESSATGGAETWARLFAELGIEAGALRTGSFLREYRNKAFREPAWSRAPTPETRREVLEEYLWQPEWQLVPVFETRFALSLGELEGQLRERLAEESRGIRRLDGVPLAGIQLKDKKIESIRLGSGETLECEKLFFADRWSTISAIEGMPKGMLFLRGREAVGVLQSVLQHEIPVGAQTQEGFFAPLHKEAGEDIERHIWGYFSSDGRQSFWTLCFLPEEAEDNHNIAKKLRRLKGVLEKMFSSAPWLPEGKADFFSNVKGEQFRFEEGILFSRGETPSERIGLPGVEGVSFLTDGYGPSEALSQVRLALEAEGLLAAPNLPVGGLTVSGTDAEAEGANSADAAFS
jgi:hypothetical protein